MPLKDFAFHRRRLWPIPSPLVRFMLGAVILVAISAASSSSRANTFTKLSSPLLTPAQFHDVAAVYDRNPAQYEVWAVGEELTAAGGSYPSPRGLVIYYNGSYWTKVSIPTTTPVLRAVDAVRFVLTSGAGRWASSAIAVGDGGTIVRLNPYTANASWEVHKKYIVSTCNQDWRQTCTTNQDCIDNGAGTICEPPGKSCHQDDIGDAAKCVNWTTANLRSVAHPARNYALAGGVGEMWRYNDTGVDQNWVPYGSFAGSTVNSIYFADIDHGWFAGVSGATAKLWRTTKESGVLDISTIIGNPGGIFTNRALTSVASILHRTATAGNPLPSIVWAGTSDGAIIRYDEAASVGVGTNPRLTVIDATRPINSLTVARRQTGDGIEMVKNSTFDADRRDSGISGRYPDGWSTSGAYRAGNGNALHSAHLIDGGLSGQAFIGEVWPSMNQTVVLRGLSAHTSEFALASGGFPNDQLYLFQGLGFTTPYPLATDQTTNIHGGLSPSFSTPPLDPYHVGVLYRGMIKIDGNDLANKTYQFRVQHPYGRAALYVENDNPNDRTCSGGTSPGSACTDEPVCPGGGTCIQQSGGAWICSGGTSPNASCTSSCPGGGTCYDQTKYISEIGRPFIESAALSWRSGACRLEPNTSCFDNNDCKWGTCAANPSTICRPGNSSALSIRQCPSATPTCNPIAGDTCVVPGTITPLATPVQESAQTVTITFPQNGGLKFRACSNDQTKSCVSDSQCTPGTCRLTGSGWYPFALEYFQVNTARCSTNDSMPCLSMNSSGCPSGGFCRNGNWCIQGTRSGLSCVDDTECPGGGGGACVPQYDPNPANAAGQGPGRCSANGVTPVDPPRPCWKRLDCNQSANPPEVCLVNTNIKPGTTALKIEWDPDDGVPGNWTEVPPSKVFLETSASSLASTSQDIPLTLLSDTAYRVNGFYKVDLDYDAFTNNQYVDPRRPARVSASVSTRCSTGLLSNSCGYDSNLFEHDAAFGVSGVGDCKNAAGIIISNNDCTSDRACINRFGTGALCVNRGICQGGSGSLCVTHADCGAGEKCNGRWAPFSLTLTKHSRNSAGGLLTPADREYNLELLCQAAIGARIACDDISVTPIVDAALPQSDLVDVWAAGNQGLVARNTINIAPSVPAENWRQLLRPVNTNLRGVIAPDPYNIWAVGDRPGGENATLLRYSPGNVNGWGWLGLGNSSAVGDAVGWIDFNCGNLQSCANQPSAYGVNLNFSYCSLDASRSCNTDLECSSVGVGVCIRTGQVSGSAWIGKNRDQNEEVNFGPCQNIISSGGVPTAACQGKTCTGDSSRSCTQDPHCRGTCAQNQSVRCMSDSDCRVRCDQNPLACRSIGWLSFDRQRVAQNDPDGGGPLPPGPPTDPFLTVEPEYSDTAPCGVIASTPVTANSPLARYYPCTGRVEGWARLQLGKCSNARNRGCFQDADCGAGNTCDYSDAISRSAPGSTTTNAEAGWVKLRGPEVVPHPPPAPVTDFFDCQDCDPATATCKICSTRQQNYACNVCSGCAGRCSNNLATSCTTDAICGAGNRCQTAGRCSNSLTTFCFTPGDCGGNPCISAGRTCTACAAGQCSRYGVSLDNQSKNFYGYAWSPDFTWLDMRRTRIGGSLFFQTEFGDIYSGGDIGSARTSRAPGHPGGSTLCNATYRIVAAGTITNVCSAADPDPTFDPQTRPFVQPGAPLLPFPSSANRYTTSIGSIDIDGIIRPVNSGAAIERNKYGDEVRRFNGNTNLSDVLSDTIDCSTTPCTARLLGRVYYIDNGDLVVDRDIRILPGRALPGTPENGSGIFVVEGVLNAQFNLDYDKATPITNRRQLASVAFIVTNANNSVPTDTAVIIQSSVHVFVGAVYAEKKVIFASQPPDSQLIVQGLIIGQGFEFNRKYRGSSGVQEPAEKITYDGRLQANTPSGLGALAKSLPQIQETTP